MVLGETEILGQVKNAYHAAQQAGATGVVLNRLFQKAFSAAKHIRSTTAITRGSTSVGTVAVDLAEKIFGKLGKCTVMVIGTGEMSGATARALQSRGAGRFSVCSRTHERAESLATQLQGRAISYDQWPAEFSAVDIVISSTAAPHPIVTREKLIPLMKTRRQRPLFLIDIAVPRDIERACGELESVYLYDIDDLQQIARENITAREREIAACQVLIAQHLQRFAAWLDGNHAALEERYRNRWPPLLCQNRPAPTRHEALDYRHAGKSARARTSSDRPRFLQKTQPDASRRNERSSARVAIILQTSRSPRAVARDCSQRKLRTSFFKARFMSPCTA